MGSMFSKPKTPDIIGAPLAPLTDNLAAKEAANREAERIRKRRKLVGEGQNIFTSSQGTTTPPTVLKEKLGD